MCLLKIVKTNAWFRIGDYFSGKVETLKIDIAMWTSNFSSV